MIDNAAALHRAGMAALGRRQAKHSYARILFANAPIAQKERNECALQLWSIIAFLIAAT